MLRIDDRVGHFRVLDHMFFYVCFDVISRHTYIAFRALALLSFFRRTEE